MSMGEENPPCALELSTEGLEGRRKRKEKKRRWVGVSLEGPTTEKAQASLKPVKPANPFSFFCFFYPAPM
jgi:hypothetical protein